MTGVRSLLFGGLLVLAQAGGGAAHGQARIADETLTPPAPLTATPAPENRPDLSSADRDAEPGSAPRTVTLTEVVAQAREHARAVLQAASGLEAAAGRAQFAVGGLLPVLAIEAGIGALRGRQIGSFGEVRDDVDFRRFEPAAGLYYRVNPGAAVARASRFRYEAAAAELTLADARRVAGLQAALGYTDLALAHASVLIASDLVQDAERFVAITRARARAEVASGAEVARAQAEAARARLARTRARERWREASIRLAVLLQWSPDQPLIPADPDLRPDARTDPDATANRFDLAMDGRPDLRAARARSLAAGRETDAAWWDLLGPEVDAGVRERLVGTRLGDLGATTQAYALIRLSLDFAALGRLRTARAEARIAEIREASLREQAGGELALALSRVESGRVAMGEASAALEAAERNRDSQLARFEAGTGTGIEVIEALNLLARARLDLAEAILRYDAARAELAAILDSPEPGHGLSP